MKQNQIEHSLPILIVFSVVFLFFYRTLNFELLSWDDYELILWNESLRGFSWEHFKVWITTPHLKSYIPVTLASLALDISLWGDKVQSFRVTNIVLHFLNACFVYGLLFRIVKTKLPALLLTFIFVLHPVQLESVLWVSQRKTLLFSFFFLLGFTSMLDPYGVDRKAKPYWKYFFSFLCFVLSVLSKPTAAAVVLVIPLYFFLHSQKRVRGVKYLHLFLSVLIFSVAYLSFSLFPNIFKDNLTGNYFYFFVKRLFTFFIYFFEIFFPGDSGLYRVPYGDYLNMGHVLWPFLIFYAALVILCLYCWKRNREVLFWGLWFFAWLLPVINIYVTPYGDRHLYLPIIGVLALGAFFTDKFKKIGAVLILLCLVGMIHNSHVRLNIWKNSETFLTEVLSTKPMDYDAAMSLAGFYEDHGRKEEARKIYWNQMMEGQSDLPYAFLNCYNLLVHSDPQDERLIRITRRHFRKKYKMDLKSVYQRLLVAKKNHEPIDAIIDEVLAKVKS